MASQPFALEKLAQFVAETTFTPDTETVSLVRDALIDTVGCILVGSRQPVAIKARQAVAVWGTGPAPVLGTSARLPVPWAALANTTAGHALDFDDWEIPGNTHPSVVIIPALLAEAAVRKTSGKELIDAYLAGFEIIARIGEAVNFEHYDAGWHSTITLGAIGVAAAVARLKRLDAEQTCHAMALCFSQAVGYTRQFGSNAKPLQAAFAAKAGILCATLAAQGLTGQPHILDDSRGFLGLMGNGDASRFGPMLEKLGTTLALKEFGLVMKPYPSCGYTTRVIDCALVLRKKLEIIPSKIKRIEASLPDFHANILPFHQPTKRAEALFSVPYTVSHSLLHGALTLADLEAETWEQHDVKTLIERFDFLIRKPINPELNYDPADPDWVTIELHNGEQYKAEVAFPLGAPQNRMSSEQIWQKFLINANYEQDKQPDLAPLRRWDEASDVNQVVCNL